MVSKLLGIKLLEIHRKKRKGKEAKIQHFLYSEFINIAPITPTTKNINPRKIASPPAKIPTAPTPINKATGIANKIRIIFFMETINNH